jgi:chromosome segregation ATPase
MAQLGAETAEKGVAAAQLGVTTAEGAVAAVGKVVDHWRVESIRGTPEEQEKAGVKLAEAEAKLKEFKAELGNAKAERDNAKAKLKEFKAELGNAKAERDEAEQWRRQSWRRRRQARKTMEDEGNAKDDVHIEDLRLEGQTPTTD